MLGYSHYARPFSLCSAILIMLDYSHYVRLFSLCWTILIMLDYSHYLGYSWRYVSICVPVPSWGDVSCSSCLAAQPFCVTQNVLDLNYMNRNFSTSDEVAQPIICLRLLRTWSVTKQGEGTEASLKFSAMCFLLCIYQTPQITCSHCSYFIRATWN